MAKLLSTRLILQDASGGLHKLCRVADDNDKYGEPYMKIIFVEFKRGLMKISRNVGFREIDGRSFFSPNPSPSTRIAADSVSYHYMAGLRHVKAKDGSRHLEHRGFPVLPDAKKPVLICRYVLKDFKPCDPVTTPDKDDIVLDNIRPPLRSGIFCCPQKGRWYPSCNSTLRGR